MNEQTFVEQRRSRWDLFEQRLRRMQAGGAKCLTGDELIEFSLGYRALTSDLALAQSRNYSYALLRYLNGIVGGGYASLYQDRAQSGWSRVAGFFRATFPQEVRRSAALVAVSALLTFGPALIASLLVAINPDNAYAFLPDAQVTLYRKSLHDSNFAFDRHLSSMMAVEIITNNVRVAALAFAGGMTAGVLTVLELVSNGFDIGASGMLYAHSGFGYDFVATIAPHGVIELTCIVLAGAGGLLMARGMLLPGRLRRSVSLTIAARRAVTLAIGAMSLLLIAGTIEGFFTPMRTSPEVRIAVGIITGTLLLTYLLAAGRNHAEKPLLTRR